MLLMSRNRLRLSLLVSIVAACAGARGGDSSSTIPTELILERFTVAKNGDDLLIPVRFAGKDHLFVVDTGASITLFDTSLPLGQPVDLATIDTPGGKTKIPLYNPPEAFVGKLPLRGLKIVAGKDLTSLRQASGNPIEGILGMDFLGKHVVHIDVPRGELLLLKSAPRNGDEAWPISYDAGGLPYTGATVGSEGPVRFVIDTGAGGLVSGDLGILEIRALEHRGEAREIGKALSETLSGTQTNPDISGQSLKLGSFVVNSPIFRESRGPLGNLLGRRFWSRFTATFDFPGNKIYLRKSSGYDRPDRWNGTGLHLWKRQGAIEVHSVDQDSPASRAGLEKGDILVELAGVRANEASLFDLFQVLCQGGPLTCVVRRNSQERRLSLGRAR